MHSISTVLLVGTLMLQTSCGVAVPVDREAQQAENDRRAAARRTEDAAISKASRERDVAFDRARAADAASRTARSIGGDEGDATDEHASASQP